MLHRPYRNRDNLINTDWQLTATELRRFKMAEGRTVVDASDIRLGRDVWGLKKITDDVGINIVSGTGYYIDPRPPNLSRVLRGPGDLCGFGEFLVDLVHPLGRVGHVVGDPPGQECEKRAG